MLFVVLSCSKETNTIAVKPLEVGGLPPGFTSIEYPEGNEFTVDRWSLGKKLFYDPILSKDGKISCASCHSPELAFSDDVALSLGSDMAIGTRNSPTLTNVAFHPYFTREGGVPTLEMQILVPIQEHNEFNNNIVDIAKQLATNNEYIDLADKAYGQDINPFVITRALANFERTLISGQSLYDLEINYNIPGSMSDQAIRGMKLFESNRTNCSTCHAGFNFTNYTFQNNGLYLHYSDEGRARLTQNKEDQAKFKVPTLRNVSLTAPYMFNGLFQTLEEVIEHYNSGGYAHVNKSDLIHPLNLSSQEKEDLLSFLLSLKDENFINNKYFRNE